MNEKTEQFIGYWEEISPELYPYLIRKTSRDDAADLMQDIAQLAYEKFTLFNKKSYLNFKRWIYGVAAKKIKKWKYKQSRLSLLRADFLDDISDMNDFVDAIILAERKEKLKRLLENLSPNEKHGADMIWSPDGKHLVLPMDLSTLWIFDREGNKVKEVKHNLNSYWASTRCEWSKDGENIIITVNNQETLCNDFKAIKVLD